MYLKSIEVQGFKSFANKLTFEFQEGITGIVGPNGSGKSNVADAVRWVLGEQSAKQLRGGQMQDVIFAGTEARKAQGFASVAITFDNSDRMLDVDYEEVTVTRRLYRSGESEYIINGSQVRLKDIQEIFYDTGIGQEGYSIIGQGQIDRILSGKAEERRELFDEAAGIVKFKKRKREALRKLDHEHQNLLRVNDILEELTSRVGPLKKQSEAARIYLDRKEELKKQEIALFVIEETRTENLLSELGSKLDAAEKELAEAKKLADEQAAIEAEKRQKDNEKLNEMAKEMARAEELKKMQMKSLMRVVIAVCVFLVFVIVAAAIMVWHKTQKKDPFKKYFEGKGQLQKDFWAAASADPDNFKYVAYMFPDLKEATAALGKLSYFNIGPGGDLKCVRDLRYGAYPHLDGAVCFVGGTKFTYALWKEASIVLPELPNASYFKVSTEPKVLLELPNLEQLSETENLHIESLGFEDIAGENGEFNRVFKYKTDTLEAARHFLDTIEVKEAGIIIHIETNEGIIGKDENGVFSIDA